MRKILITIAFIVACSFLIWRSTLSPEAAATLTVIVGLIAAIAGGFDPPKENP